MAKFTIELNDEEFSQIQNMCYEKYFELKENSSSSILLRACYLNKLVKHVQLMNDLEIPVHF
jgi:hypothetical protein